MNDGSTAKKRMSVMPPLDQLVPRPLRALDDPARDLPRIAKDPPSMALITAAVEQVPSHHEVLLGDARRAVLPPESVHLVLTSPPYWTLKEYRRTSGQLGWIVDYEEFLDELDAVWRLCHRALVPGGRLICVVGDVCLSRRKNGRHVVVPLHASIQNRSRGLGFDNLAPIIWHKIANVSHEVQRGSAGLLGKPYEPNAVIKNDIELDDPFIAWRYRDSISLQEFLRCGLAKTPPEQSTLAKTRKRLSLETDGAVVGWVLERLRESGLLRGRTVAFNLSLLMSGRFGFATPRALQALAMAAAGLANASARGLAVILGRIGRIPGLLGPHSATSRPSGRPSHIRITFIPGVPLLQPAHWETQFFHGLLDARNGEGGGEDVVARPSNGVRDHALHYFADPW